MDFGAVDSRASGGAKGQRLSVWDWLFAGLMIGKVPQAARVRVFF